MRTIGILDALPAAYRQVNGGVTEADKVIQWLGEPADVVWERYTVADNEFPASPEDCDIFVITGSPASVNQDEPWIDRLVGFVQAAYAADRQLVGICFGHQIIARALGGRVEAAGWMFGSYRFEVFDRPAWMTAAGSECEIYHINQDQVVELPVGATPHGRSEHCPNTLFTIENQVFSIQGHPEQNRVYMEQFVDFLRGEEPEDVLNSAADMIATATPHGALVAEWVWRFLDQEEIAV